MWRAIGVPDAGPLTMNASRSQRRISPPSLTETVKVPAGTYNTVVVRPTIKTSGLFGEGGQAELFFSDDEHHILVQLRSKVKVVGSLSLHLKSYTPPTER